MSSTPGAMAAAKKIVELWNLEDAAKAMPPIEYGILMENAAREIDRHALLLRLDAHSKATTQMVDAAPDLLQACMLTIDCAQHEDGCGWWDIPVSTMNASERSQQEQLEKCSCFIKTVRSAVIKAGGE